MKKDITVIITLYKTPLKRLKDLNQYKNYKVIIFAQEANKHYQNIIKKNSLINFRYYFSKDNIGLPKATNYLISKVKTKYFLFTQADILINEKSIQYLKNSFKTMSFVSCPATPKIELININRDAVLVICFGSPALRRNKIGLKNIPPPIPTNPDINPIIEPIKIETAFETCLIPIWSLLKDLLSNNKKIPAINKIKNSKISNKSLLIEIEAPRKAKGTDPIK